MRLNELVGNVFKSQLLIMEGKCRATHGAQKS